MRLSTQGARAEGEEEEEEEERSISIPTGRRRIGKEENREQRCQLSHLEHSPKALSSTLAGYIFFCMCVCAKVVLLLL